MFFIEMMENKKDIRGAYVKPVVEIAAIKLENGIAQSLSAAGQYEDGGDLQTWE